MVKLPALSDDLSRKLLQMLCQQLLKYMAKQHPSEDSCILPVRNITKNYPIDTEQIEKSELMQPSRSMRIIVLSVMLATLRISVYYH